LKWKSKQLINEDYPKSWQIWLNSYPRLISLIKLKKNIYILELFYSKKISNHVNIYLLLINEALSSTLVGNLVSHGKENNHNHHWIHWVWEAYENITLKEIIEIVLHYSCYLLLVFLLALWLLEFS
jgi:hypothetical protein